MRSFLNENIHASSRRKLNWNSINWKKVEKKVKELQIRIAKAVREGRYRKAQSLQWLITHSFYAKLLAVKRVVTNKGNFVSIRASGSFHTRIGLLKCLSQCAGKPAYTVLRGLGIGDNPRLPDYPLYLFQLRNIGRIPHCIFDMTTEYY